MKKRCGGIQGWALRYLVLDKANKILYYYKSPKDEEPRKALDLNACTISRLTPDESRKNPGFKIIMPNIREFVFIGANAPLVDDWINALFQAKTPTSMNPQAFANIRAPLGAAAAMQQPSGTNTVRGTGKTTVSGYDESFNYPGTTLNEPQSPQKISAARPNANANGRTMTNTTDGNNTLIGNGEGGTLVANGASQRLPVGQPIPFLVLTSETRKFPPIEKGIVGIIKVGRYVNNHPITEDMITFKSKVISRAHAEIWSVNGEVYIRDTKSQSGTFLNAMRLSEPGRESKPYKLKSGDVIQFGVDYKGATDDSARCISVRIELKTKTLEAGHDHNMIMSSTGHTTKSSDNQTTSTYADQNGTLYNQTTTKRNDKTLTQPDQRTLNAGQQYGHAPNSNTLTAGINPRRVNPGQIMNPAGLDPNMGPQVIASNQPRTGGFLRRPSQQ